jgi:hypothetical protein
MAASREELAAQLAKLFPPGTVTDEQLVRSGMFELRTLKYRELSKDLQLTDSEHAVARVSIERVPPLVVDIDRGKETVGIEIVDVRTQGSLISVGKHDSDSQLNSLRYTVADTSGKAVIQVFDYEMDGQADVRMHYASPSYAEVWYRDRWFRVERRGEDHGVYVDGHFKRVRDQNGRLHVETP